MDTTPEPLLLSTDLSLLCGGASGQPEVIVSFNAAMKTCHLEPIGCEPCLAGFFFGLFLLFL